MATTPPARIEALTPPTPLHGGRYDTYHAATTRKSTRHSSRTQRAIGTPPLYPDNPQKLELDPRKASASRSQIHSPPSSTHNSPQKSIRRGLPKDASEMGPASTSRAASLDSINGSTQDQPLQHPSLKLSANMLPTPTKTPRKKPVQPPSINAAARVLFPARPTTVEDAMPSPHRKRKNKRHVGFSLYSSHEDDEASSESKIEVYTDSKDKVPELDPSEENPFLEQPDQVAPPPEPCKERNSRKRKAGQSVDASEEIKNAFNRKDGMVYVFRGKKIFRKFPDDGLDPDKTLENSEIETSILRPLTRSSMKPRLLFPTPQQRQERIAAAIEDEEAPTDIEDHHDHEMTEPEGEPVVTPVKAIFSQAATPPATGHATRSSTKKVAAEPTEAMPYEGKSKKASPFDGWARTKAGVGLSAGKGKKRDGETMEMGSCKKTRS